ncbi:tape measure protein [bacterium]|nr:tape measure protein [bacterium]
MAFKLAEAFVELKQRGLEQVGIASTQAISSLRDLTRNFDSMQSRFNAFAPDKIQNMTLGEAKTELANLGSEIQRINDQLALNPELDTDEARQELAAFMSTYETIEKEIESGELNFKPDTAVKQLKKVERQAKDTRHDIERPARFRINTASALMGLKKVSSAVGRMQFGLGGMLSGGGMLGGGLAALGATAGISGILGLAADAEQTSVSFSVLTGSTEQAQKTLADLRQFAATTPFQFPEITDSAKKLIAFGFNADEVTGQLRKLGDISAGLNIPLGELSEIYGKAKVSGRLFMEDINQLAGRGIPIQAELAKQFGVSGEKVRDLVSSGKVNFGHLQQAIDDLTGSGGKFSGLMAAQSTTLGGLWSTLKDNVTMRLTEIGTEISETFDLKGVMTSAIGWIDSMQEPLMNFLKTSKFVWDNFGLITAIKLEEANIGFWNFIERIRAGFMFAVETVFWYGENFGSILGNAAQQMQTLGSNVVSIASWMFDNWRGIFTDLYNITGTIFQNLASNVMSIVTELWDFIKSGGTDAVNIDWTPLTAGFKSQIKEMPQLSEFAMTDGFKAALDKLPEYKPDVKETSPMLESLNQQLADNYAAAFLKSEKATSGDAEKDAQKSGSDAAAKTAADTAANAKGDNTAAIVGSSTAANLLAKAFSGGSNDPQEAIKKNTKDTADAMKTLAKAAKNGPVIVGRS